MNTQIRIITTVGTAQKANSPSTGKNASESLLTEIILVVDDHGEFCEVTSILLRRSGYRVLAARSGQQAKQVARENPGIDLLLTDVEMPGMSGDELAQWFRITCPGTAVAFMSGNPMQQYRMGHRYFIEKPFNHCGSLLKTVCLAINERHATMQTTPLAA